jgi:arabinofuranosyltransferase
MAAMAPTGTPSATLVGERARHTRPWLLLLIPVVVIVVLGWSHRWVEEDAFLNFRIVDQIRAGHGPVFNVGERVEVATSPLWLGVLVVARTVLPFVAIEHVSIVLGLALTGVGVWWAQRAAMTFWRRDRSEVGIPFGALVFVALPVAWDWSTGGLENGLSIAWLGALALLVARAGRTGTAMGTAAGFGVGVVIGVGALVRPDLAVVAGCGLVGLVVARRSRGRELVALVAGAAALPIVTEVFRAVYYGVLGPNTALAKDSSGAYWSQGWNYLVDVVAPYWLWVPLLAVGVVVVVLARERVDATPPLAAVLALPVGGVLHALFITASGGDYLHGRLLLPSLFAVLVPAAAVPWRPWLRLALVVLGGWALVTMVALRPGLHEALVPVTDHGVVQGRALMSRLTLPGHRPVLASDFDFDDGERARRLQARGERALVAGPEPLLDVTRGRTTLVSPASGISGYEAGPDVLVREVNSLADPVGSHMTPTPLSKPGHRKRLEWAWLLAIATRPGTGPYTFENLGAIPLVGAEFDDGRIDPADNDAARRALDCGALAELVASANDRLDATRAWDNLTGAIGRTRLVVPRDPHAAARQFCGDR